MKKKKKQETNKEDGEGILIKTNKNNNQLNKKRSLR